MANRKPETSPAPLENKINPLKFSYRMVTKGRDSFIEIRNGWGTHQVKIAKPEDLSQVKELDDIAFGQHQGISLVELEHLVEHGVVLMLCSSNGKLIGESQILLFPCPDDQYMSHLEEDEAYCYGTAVEPGERGSGTAQTLFQAQEAAARQNNKRRTWLTVRAENPTSVRARLNFGFTIIGYNPNYYGSLEDGGGRMIMSKDLQKTPSLADTQALAKQFMAGEIPVATADNTVESSMVGIYVQTGDAVDIEANQNIQTFIQRGYIGIALLHPNELGSAAGKSLYIFIKPECR